MQEPEEPIRTDAGAVPLWVWIMFVVIIALVIAAAIVNAFGDNF